MYPEEDGSECADQERGAKRMNAPPHSSRRVVGSLWRSVGRLGGDAWRGRLLPAPHMLWGLLLRMRIGLRRPEAFGWCFANPDHLTDAFIDRVIGPLADGHRRTGVMNYILNLDLGFIDQLREVHPKIEARVSFIWGAQDHWFPLADARGMVEQVRDCVGFTTVDDAALMVHEECPDAVAAAMRKHLEVQNPGANTSAKRAGLRTP